MFERIPKMLNEAFTELQEIQMDKRRIETELKFTQRLKKSGNDYAEHVRAGAIARLLNKDKGDIIHWYETIKETRVNRKNGSGFANLDCSKTDLF